MDATILVIEESLDLRRLFEYMLRADGHTVISFDDWQSAQPSLITRPVDLIIYDWPIADATGYRWAEAIHHGPATAHIPILFVSSDLASRAAVDLIGGPGVSLIEKPFDIFVFRNRIAALLGSRERAAGA